MAAGTNHGSTPPLSPEAGGFRVLSPLPDSQNRPLWRGTHMNRTQESFDTGWTFRLGEFATPPRRILSKGTTAGGFSDLAVDEIPETASPNIIESYGAGFQTSTLKARSARQGWQDVTLPHDWRIELPQAPDHPERKDYPRSWQGYFP